MRVSSKIIVLDSKGLSDQHNELAGHVSGNATETCPKITKIRQITQNHFVCQGHSHVSKLGS